MDHSVFTVGCYWYYSPMRTGELFLVCVVSPFPLLILTRDICAVAIIDTEGSSSCPAGSSRDNTVLSAAWQRSGHLGEEGFGHGHEPDRHRCVVSVSHVDRFLTDLCRPSSRERSGRRERDHRRRRTGRRRAPGGRVSAAIDGPPRCYRTDRRPCRRRGSS